MDLNQIQYYSEFVQEVSMYLHRTILKNFPSISIGISLGKYPDGRKTYAYNRYDLILLYINQFYKPSNIVYTKNSILYTLIHESFHQLQIIDMNKYTINENYNNIIEANVDATAVDYINSNLEELSILFKIPIYVISRNKVKKTYDYPMYISDNISRNNDLNVTTFIRVVAYYSKFYNISDLYRTFYNNDCDIWIKDRDNTSKYQLSKNGIINYDTVNFLIKHRMGDYYLYRRHVSKFTKISNTVVFLVEYNDDRLLDVLGKEC